MQQVPISACGSPLPSRYEWEGFIALNAEKCDMQVSENCHWLGSASESDSNVVSMGICLEYISVPVKGAPRTLVLRTGACFGNVHIDRPKNFTFKHYST